MTIKKTMHTPLMAQYFTIKEQYRDELVLFQVGDFYELFFDDAKKAAEFLGITLTKRGHVKGEPIPLCGVPVHAKDHYIRKLVKGGFKVALCDQLEQARPGVIVKRGVTQVLTPGTLTDNCLLDTKSASYLFAFFPTSDHLALLFGELLTAQLFATVVPTQQEKAIEVELLRFFPDEIISPNNKESERYQHFFKKNGYFTTLIPEVSLDIGPWIEGFDTDVRQKVLAVPSLYEALRMFYGYLRKNQVIALDQFKSIHFYESDDFLILDAATQETLNLIKNNQDSTKKNSLFDTIDGAATPMGSRMIKKWLTRPLVSQDAIEERLDAVEELRNDIEAVHTIKKILSSMGDFERVIGRIALYRATINDYQLLTSSLDLLPDLKNELMRKNARLLHIINAHISDMSSLKHFLITAIAHREQSDEVIKKGFDRELDHMRMLVYEGSDRLLQLEQKEREKTGISSLKVRFNRVSGYYIEITKAHEQVLLPEYIKQQKLVGKSRFTTIELQELQQELLDARSQIEQREKELFERVKKEVAASAVPLRRCAYALAQLDALYGLAMVAYRYNYVRPTIADDRMIVIEEGRHPVVELAQEAVFVPNSTRLTDEESLWVLTGPNMGGKSTYLRQVAHIVIMAHIGSFVPASRASISVLDRLFTRIGAQDNLTAGKSTFLVEMEETATICTQATERSLVILDEVGRGTSTFDGLALAQAVLEHLYTKVKARCLFATHYQELTALADHHAGIVNYYAVSKKMAHGIVFLYKIAPGVADGSFGIEVAKLAQLPETVITRARTILQNFHIGSEEALKTHRQAIGAVAQQGYTDFQLLAQENAVLKKKLERLAAIDYNHLSPKQAFDILWKLNEQE